MFLYRKLSQRFLNNLLINSRTIITSTYPDVSTKGESLAEHVFEYCKKFPNNIACIDDVKNISYSYWDFKTATENIASGITKKGFKQGDMVAIIASNCPEYLMLIYAISSIGCSVTICNQNYTTNEIQFQLMDSRPSIIFTSRDYLEKVSVIASQLSFIKEIYLIDGKISGFGSVEDLMNDSGNMSPIGDIKLNLDDQVALMPYSSGTTGLPKGVMLTHTNLVSNFKQLLDGHKLTKTNTMIVALPLYHIYATMIIPSMAFPTGSTMVFQPKFDPIKFLTAIDKYKINVLHLVPPQILFILNHPASEKFNLSSIEKCFSAAAPLDAQIEKRFIDKFRNNQPDFDIYQGYGLSETSPVTHMMPNIKKDKSKQGSVGLMLPSMKCKIVDISTRQELSVNESGEILLQGPNIMKGYFGKAKDTENAFENNWFKTGDIGHFDKDQYFYISDRIKELIKVKGLQVAPAELEATLLGIPGVADCAVIGVPDERCGELPKAFIVRNIDISEKDINEYMEINLSPHKQLKGGIVFVNEIPKSPSGKILRRLLKET